MNLRGCFENEKYGDVRKLSKQLTKICIGSMV